MENKSESDYNHGHGRKRDGRRSSGILKMKRPCLAEIPPDQVTEQKEETVDCKRLSRRVSFAERCIVKEFPKDSPRIWDQSPDASSKKDDPDDTLTEDMSGNISGLDLLLNGEIQSKENKRNDEMILNRTRLDIVDMDMTSCYNGELSIHQTSMIDQQLSTAPSVSAVSFLTDLKPTPPEPVKNENPSVKSTGPVLNFQTDFDNGELTMDLTGTFSGNKSPTDKDDDMEITTIKTSTAITKRQSLGDITRRFSSGPLAEMELTVGVPSDQTVVGIENDSAKAQADMEITCNFDQDQKGTSTVKTPSIDLSPQGKVSHDNKENAGSCPNFDFSLHQSFDDDIDITFKDNTQQLLGSNIEPISVPTKTADCGKDKHVSEKENINDIHPELKMPTVSSVEGSKESDVGLSKMAVEANQFSVAEKENVPRCPKFDFSLHQGLDDDLEFSFKDSTQHLLGRNSFAISDQVPQREALKESVPQEKATIEPLAQKDGINDPVPQKEPINDQISRKESTNEPPPQKEVIKALDPQNEGKADNSKLIKNRLPSLNKEKEADISGIDFLEESQSPVIDTGEVFKQNEKKLHKAQSNATIPSSGAHTSTKGPSAYLSGMDLLDDSLSLSKVLGSHDSVLEKSQAKDSNDVQELYSPNRKENSDLKRSFQNIDVAQVEVHTGKKLHRKGSGNESAVVFQSDLKEKHGPTLNFLNASSTANQSILSQSFMSSLQNKTLGEAIVNESLPVQDNEILPSTIMDKSATKERTNTAFGKSLTVEVSTDLVKEETTPPNMEISMSHDLPPPVSSVPSINNSCGDRSMTTQDKSQLGTSLMFKDCDLNISDEPMPGEMTKNEIPTATYTLSDNTYNKSSTDHNNTTMTNRSNTSSTSHSSVFNTTNTSTKPCVPWTYDMFCEKMSIYTVDKGSKRASIVVKEKVDMESFQEVLEARLTMIPQCQLLESAIKSIEDQQIKESEMVDQYKDEVDKEEPELFKTVREGLETSDIRKEVLRMTRACKQLAKQQWKNLKIQTTKIYHEQIKKESVELENGVKEILDSAADITQQCLQLDKACTDVDESIERLQNASQTVEENVGQNKQDIDELQSVLEEKNKHLKEIELDVIEKGKELEEIEARSVKLENTRYQQPDLTIDAASKETELKLLKKKLDFFRLITEWSVDFDCFTDTGGMFLFLDKSIALNVHYKLFEDNQHQIRGVQLKSRVPANCEPWFELGHCLAMEQLNSLKLNTKYLGQNSLSKLLQEVSQVIYKIRRLIKDLDNLDYRHPVTIENNIVRFNVLNMDTVKKVKVYLTFNSKNITTPSLDIKSMVGQINIDSLKEELKVCKGQDFLKQSLSIIKQFLTQ